MYSKVIFIYLLKTYCRSLKKFRAKNYNKCYLKIVLKFLVQMFFLNLGKNRRKKGALTLLGDTDVSGMLSTIRSVHVKDALVRLFNMIFKIKKFQIRFEGSNPVGSL